MKKTLIYPSDKRIELDGGINTKFERSIIMDNESPSCANVVFKNGAVQTREGVTKVTVSGIGSYQFDAIFNRQDNTSAETMVAFANGDGFLFSSNTFVTLPSAQSIYTAGQQINGAQYENHLFIGNGAITPYKYNGTDFTRHGIYPISTAPAATSAAAGGNLNGYYSWKVTAVNSALVESDVGTASSFLTITAGHASLVVGVAPQSWGVATRNIYRTVTSGTTYLKVGSIANNTTTTFDDNIADASLGALAPTDNGVPKLYSVIHYFRDRLFINDPSEPNLVWYSNLADPYTFPATNFFRIGDNTTDIVRAFASTQNGLIVFCDESFTFVYMPDTTAANWSVVPGSRQYGCKSPKGIINFQDKVIFPAIQRGKFIGFAALEGANVQPSQTFLTVLNAGSFLQSDKIEPDMFLINSTYLNSVAAIVHKDRAYFSVPYGSAQTTNNRIYLYEFSIEDLSKPQKFTWVPWTGLNAKQFVINQGLLYYVASDSTGHLQKTNNGAYNDNGSAIDSYVWTKEFGGSGTDFHYHKDFRHLFALVDQPGAYNMGLNVRVNSDDSDGDVYAIDLSPGGMVWGDDWGTSTWGGGRLQDEKRVSLNQAGFRIQFMFSNQNTVNQRFSVHAIGFSYNKKGIR